MANTYTSLYYHIVFSTKNRVRWIPQEIEERIWAYVGGIARKNRMTALEVGGIEDHLHALVMAPPAIAPSKIAQLLKGDSLPLDSHRVSRAARFCLARRLRRVYGQ